MQTSPDPADPEAVDEGGLVRPLDEVRGAVAAPGGRWPARHRYALLAAVVTVLTTIQTANGQWSSDMWEHVAVVRELIANPFDPSHPQLLSDAPHPGFSPYTVALGLLGNLFDASAVTVLSVAAVVNVVLLLAALRMLVIEATANERAPFWTLVFVLALWGVAPYRYSGFFNVNSIGFVAPYPSTFATAAGLATLVAALRYARDGRRGLLGAVTGGTALVALVHPLSAPWLVVALVIVAISRRRDPRELAWFAGAGAVAAGVCLLWPYFSMVEMAQDSTSLESLNRSMYTNVMPRVLPVLLGLVVIVRRSRADHRDLLGLWLAGAGALYVMGAITDNTSYGRSLAFAVIILCVALADGVARIEAGTTFRDASTRVRVGLGVLAGLLVLGLVPMRGGLIRMVPEQALPASVRESRQLIRPDERYGFLVGIVGRTEVVIGSQSVDNRVIPALAGRTLALSVPRPFVDDVGERRRAQTEYLDPATDADRRGQIQERYDGQFVLLHADDPDDRALLEILRDAGATVAHRGGGLVLVEL